MWPFRTTSVSRQLITHEIETISHNFKKILHSLLLIMILIILFTSLKKDHDQELFILDLCVRLRLRSHGIRDVIYQIFLVKTPC